MKEKIRRFKNFICFYLTLPIFILTVLASGFVPPPQTPSKRETVSAYHREECEILPTAHIKGEISNPEGTHPIVARNLSKSFNILNATDEVIDEEELISYPLPHADSEPLVLVVHTHGTECYSDASASFGTADTEGNYGYYTDASQTRTTDTSKNVVAVGEAFCMELAHHGIPSIQCRIMHDKDDYNSAYANSRKSILEYLDKYPTIKYIIDLHRDSLGGDGGEKIKTVASGIEDCAQIMLVAGCNGNGVIYPDWKANLSLALKYKKVTDEKYSSLSRPIYLRYSRYNLDLRVGSLLLEVGSCANTLDEALNAAKLAAECFAEMLK